MRNNKNTAKQYKMLTKFQSHVVWKVRGIGSITKELDQKIFCGAICPGRNKKSSLGLYQKMPTVNERWEKQIGCKAVLPALRLIVVIAIIDPMYHTVVGQNDERRFLVQLVFSKLP